MEDDRAAQSPGHPDDRVRAQTRLRLDECRALVVNPCEPARKFFRGDEHVYVRQKLRESFVYVVNVERDDCARGAGLSRESSAGARVVRVHVQHAPARGEVTWRFLLSVCEALVPVPDDRALARARVNDDEGDLVARALDDFGSLDINALRSQRLKPEAACVVRAEATGVSGSHAEALQARERCRRLTARDALVFDEANCRVELRVSGPDDEVVNGI